MLTAHEVERAFEFILFRYRLVAQVLERGGETLPKAHQKFEDTAVRSLTGIRLYGATSFDPDSVEMLGALATGIRQRIDDLVDGSPGLRDLMVPIENAFLSLANARNALAAANTIPAKRFADAAHVLRQVHVALVFGDDDALRKMSLAAWKVRDPIDHPLWFPDREAEYWHLADVFDHTVQTTDLRDQRQDVAAEIAQRLCVALRDALQRCHDIRGQIFTGWRSKNCDADFAPAKATYRELEKEIRVVLVMASGDITADVRRKVIRTFLRGLDVPESVAKAALERPRK